MSTVLASDRFKGNHLKLQYLGPPDTDPESVPAKSYDDSGSGFGSNSDTGTNSDETSSGDPSDDPLTDISTGIENLDKIWSKIRPDFSSMNPSGTSDYSLHVPLNTSVGDFSFDIGGWSTVCGGSLDTFRSLLRGISKFIFSCVFVFGLVYTFRQW